MTRARNNNPAVMLEVEVENEGQLHEALEAGADRLLLDNHSISALKNAVSTVAGGVELEASGNVTLDNVRDIALTGVDYISTGSLTKDIKAIDLSMIFS